MSNFTYGEYYEMVRVYLLSNENLRAARRRYERESVPRMRAQGILNPTVPNERTILAANQRLLDHGQFRTPSQFGKTHLPWYRYRSEMLEEVFDTGFDKQLFKQSVARRLLEQLSLRGYDVPPHLSSPSALNELMDLVGMPTYSFVVLVSELCREYRLDPVEYEVLADPAGQPSITVKARIGYVERVATAASKRIAHQLAAEQIYKHLRTMLRGTRDFNEEEAMFGAYTRTMRQIGDEQRASLGEQQRKKMEEQAAAKAEKNKQSSAVQATVLMELDQSEQTSYEVGSALPPPGTPNAHEQDSNKAQAPDGDVHQAAVQLLQLTMERLGI